MLLLPSSKDSTSGGRSIWRMALIDSTQGSSRCRGSDSKALFVSPSFPLLLLLLPPGLTQIPTTSPFWDRQEAKRKNGRRDE